jgi:hypothetical protein
LSLHAPQIATYGPPIRWTRPKYNTEPARLVAAFDAAGKEDSECVVVAGFISSHKDWSSFNAKWLERLKKDGIDYFHMVEFAQSRKQFANGWKDDEPRRHHLHGDLLDIIKSHVYRQFASVVEMGTFDTLSGENKKEYSLNAYALAARSCAADVRMWQVRERFQPPTGYAFEDGDDGKGKISERFLEDGLSRPEFKLKKDTIKDGAPVRAYTPL